MGFEVVEVESGARPFRITVGLQVGFKKGLRHHHTTAQRTVKKWMKTRAKARKSYVTGVLSTGTIMFAHGSGESANVGTEPGVVFAGSVSSRSLAGMSDDNVKAMLNDLAYRLGKKLGQVRVEMLYRQWSWAVIIDS